MLLLEICKLVVKKHEAGNVFDYLALQLAFTGARLTLKNLCFFVTF